MNTPRRPYPARPDDGAGAVFWLVWAVLFLGGLALAVGGLVIANTPSVPFGLALIAAPGALMVLWCLGAAIRVGAVGYED